jgi:hypothetical protein
VNEASGTYSSEQQQKELVNIAKNVAQQVIFLSLFLSLSHSLILSLSPHSFSQVLLAIDSELSHFSIKGCKFILFVHYYCL